MARLFFIILLITILHLQQSNTQTLTNKMNVSTSNELKTYSNLISRKLRNVWNWVKDESKDETTFVGRCFGIGKRLKFAMPLVIFLLGVIITTMKFLTLFTLKSVGIGVLLLILNFGALFAKLGAHFKDNSHEHKYQQPQNVHFHIHNKDGLNHVDHSTTGWADRVSEGLSQTNNLAEKMELINLYKRLGFKVDNNLPVFKYS